MHHDPSPEPPPPPVDCAPDPAAPRCGPVDRHIGARLRRRRLALGLRLETVSTDLGIAPTTLDEFERGARRLDAANLIALASYMKVKPSEFFRNLRLAKLLAPLGAQTRSSKRKPGRKIENQA
jgi:transcriptional regulator with XRE-family HTH domain